MRPFTFSHICIAVALTSFCALSACTQQREDTGSVLGIAPIAMEGQMTPVKTAIACLPRQAALIAAHRGVSADWDLPENSASGLQRLMDENYLVAEIDVASTRDGTLFLYHDGVWDDTSTGKGPVSASTTQDLDKILLKSRRGTLASERPLLFEQALSMAKNKLYLEIDFKSSAPEAKVIDAINDKNMGGQVILISYTSEQAARLHALAPNMVLSAPGQDNGKGLNPETTLLWMGRKISTVNKPTRTLGYIGMIGHESAAGNAGPLLQGRLLVTDFPSEYPPILGLSQDRSDDYEHCLTGENQSDL